MADNRYQNNIHINRHQPLSLNLSNPNHPLNHGWKFSHHNDEFDQAIYTQEGMKLTTFKRGFVTFKDKWVVEFSDDKCILYEGTMEEITEDALKELV